MIDGVITKDLIFHCDERGRLAEIFRRDDPFFKQFGQVYLTTTYPGVIKGWHLHKKQTDHVACIKGMLKVVLYDNRPKSKTKGQINEFFVGENNFQLITIPKGVYHGWKCIADEESWVINVPDQPYNHKKPDEYRLSHNDPKIGYDWSIKLK